MCLEACLKQDFVDFDLDTLVALQLLPAHCMILCCNIGAGIDIDDCDNEGYSTMPPNNRLAAIIQLGIC